MILPLKGLLRLLETILSLPPKFNLNLADINLKPKILAFQNHIISRRFVENLIVNTQFFYNPIIKNQDIDDKKLTNMYCNYEMHNIS